MRKLVARSSSLFLCASSILLGALLSGSTGDLTDVVVVDALDPKGPYKRIWQPHFAKWKDDHYVSAYGLELRGKYDMGDMICSITTDGGKTWSPRITVFDHRIRNGTVQYAYANPVLFRPPGQDVIWLFCMRAPLHYRDSENSDLAAAYTADGGYSWTHVELSVGYQGNMIIVGGITTVMRDGVPHYLLPAHRNSFRHDKTGDRRQFLLESTSLVKWKLSNYIEVEEPVFLHEGNLAYIGDDEIKMIMRTSRMDIERPLNPALAYSTVSKDGGLSWSVAKPEPELPNFRAKSSFEKDSLGNHIYVYSDRFERHALLYKTREQGGSWSEEKLFYHENNRNSYPTLIEDSPGNWLVMFDSSNDPEIRRDRIRFGRLILSN